MKRLLIIVTALALGLTFAAPFTATAAAPTLEEVAARVALLEKGAALPDSRTDSANRIANIEANLARKEVEAPNPAQVLNQFREEGERISALEETAKLYLPAEEQTQAVIALRRRIGGLDRRIERLERALRRHR